MILLLAAVFLVMWAVDIEVCESSDTYRCLFCRLVDRKKKSK